MKPSEELEMAKLRLRNTAAETPGEMTQAVLAGRSVWLVLGAAVGLGVVAARYPRLLKTAGQLIVGAYGAGRSK